MKTLKEMWEEHHYMNLLGLKIYDEVSEECEQFSNGFHYTTLETFWNMVKSDLMFARNVRFSNDSEEYKLGEKIINEILLMPNEEEQDLYMICFCTEKNLLSQWREYAKNGVCLGFDLAEEDYYSIRNTSQTEELLKTDSYFKDYEKYGIPAHGRYDKEKWVYTYAKLLKVFYVGEKYDEIKLKYKKINDMLTDDELPADKFMHYMIPYIKHKGFKEESEARLIFKLENQNREYQVNYLEEDGLKKPYIKLEFGKIEEKKQEKCIIKIDHIGEFSAEFQDYVQTIEEDLDLTIDIENVNEHTNGQIIIGCCKKQQEIFERLDAVVSAWNYSNPKRKIKLWCKGHLPIREIMVGPGPNKNEVRESIQHYIRNVYWLKYVDVECSDIPYREKK